MLKASLATFAVMDAVASTMFSSGPVSAGALGATVVLTIVSLYPMVNGWTEKLFRGEPSADM